MVQFIEKHRRLLQAYCIIARLLGWFLILGGIFWIFATVKTFEAAKDVDEMQIDIFLYIIYSFVYDFVIPGFLAFAIGGLLDYLLRPKTKPPLILGMMDKLCYLYAIFLTWSLLGTIVTFGVDPWFADFRFLSISEISESGRILLLQSAIWPTVAKILLLIGIGMIMHRLLPVIEESKTLV